MAITRAQQARQLYRSAGAVEAAYGKSAAKAGPVERGGGRNPMVSLTEDPVATAQRARERIAEGFIKTGLGTKLGLTELPIPSGRIAGEVLNIFQVPQGTIMDKIRASFKKNLRPPTVEKDRNEGTGIVPYWAQLGFNSEAEYLASLQAQEAMTMDDQETLTPVQQALLERGDAIRFAAEGGIMDLDTGRQMYGLGKLVKKITRGVKKIAKSPIGKAALLYAGTAGLGSLAAGGGMGSLFKLGTYAPSTFAANLPGIFTRAGVKNILVGAPGKYLGSPRGVDTGILTKGTSGIFGTGGKLSAGKLITATSLLPLLGIGTGDESEEEAEELLRGQGIDIAAIRANPNQYLARRFRAEGGIMRQQYQEGSKEPVAKKTMPLLDMGGMEKDYREDGGFVPIGRMEKADDVPARLSKNEFVFTADAVRNAGDGDIDKGAEVMYNMMKNLEAGGEVSEESQGLEGARNMFQTSRRLEEVL